MLAEAQIKEKVAVKKVLIIGWNVEAVSLYDLIISVPALGYEVIGFIKPDGPGKDKYYKNIPVLGDVDNLSLMMRNYDI
ncbi:MAG: hypothetical protein GF313_12815, partial [Caldithrix sp.]|nr:hypothetical protein [Caldithrix sp.]